MSFLVWFDPNKKVDPLDKAKEAIRMYEAKHGRRPKELQVNASTFEAMGEPDVFMGVDVRIARYVARNTFYVGEQEPLTTTVRAKFGMDIQ